MMISLAALLYNFYGGYYNGTPDHGYFETHTYERNDFSHTLLDPFRAKQVWRMMVTIKEMKDGAPIGEAGSRIEARLRNKFADCFQEMLTICDRTATSVQVINANVEYAKGVFESNKDILQQFAKELGVKKYIIDRYCDNRRISVREGYTVETD